MSADSSLSAFAALASPDPAPTTSEATASPVEETSSEVPNIEVTEESPEGAAEPSEGIDASDGGDDKPVDARTNPAAVRNALKKLRDMGPEYAPIARQLNDAFGRHNAYKAAFPKVADAQNARALLDAVGGNEGFAALQEQVKAITATDEKLYSGSPEVLKDIYEDMKAAGKQDAFGKLAGPFLEQLRSVDEGAYFNAMKPHFYQGLRDVGLQNVFASLSEALTGEQPNINGAKSILSNLNTWFEDLKTSVDSSSKQTLDPERQAFEAERQKFATERQAEFNNGVATDCDKHNNDSLLGALKQYTKLPAFKGWSKDSWVDLGQGLKQQLLSELTQDKTYQAQMDAFFSQKSPDKGKIVAFHQQKVDSMSARIVKQLLERRYPGYNKVGAKAAPKPGGAKPAVNATDAQTGKVQFNYQKSKPDWESIDWSADPQKTAYITGRAKLKNGQFISWNAKDRR